MLSRRLLLAAAAGSAFAGPAVAWFGPVIEAFHPDFWGLIDRRAVVDRLAGGGNLGTVPMGQADYGASLECPLWHPDGFLLFSDIPQNRVMKWTPGGDIELFLEPTGHANGLWLDAQGRLLMAEHSGRQVSRLERNGAKTVVMRSYRNQRLKRPNTVVTRSDGGIYFTDFGFRTGPVEDWDVDHEGIYYVSPDLGARILLARDIEAPHKLLFSRDEKTLLVGQYQGVLAYDVADVASPVPSESLSGGRLVQDSRRWLWRAGGEGDPAVLRDLVASGARLVDGIKLDEQENLWFSGRHGVWVVSRAGSVLGRIDFGKSVPNLGFGGPDGRTLFVTANHELFAVPTLVRGLERPEALFHRT